MLRGVHPLIGPDLLRALCEMGHGDEVVLADVNFPAAFLGPRVIRADGVGGEALLDAILTHFPLDNFEPAAAFSMAVVDDPARVPAICSAYQAIIRRRAGPFDLVPLERFAFYERARKAAYVIATGERSFYGNVVLKKGVIAPDAVP